MLRQTRGESATVCVLNRRVDLHAIDATLVDFHTGQHGKMGEPHCPFGAGPRICVGYALAQLELVALLHAVLRRYELFPAGPGYPEPREHVLVTNGPRESGLFLKLVPR